MFGTVTNKGQQKGRQNKERIITPKNDIRRQIQTNLDITAATAYQGLLIEEPLTLHVDVLTEQSSYMCDSLTTIHKGKSFSISECYIVFGDTLYTNYNGPGKHPLSTLNNR